MSLSNFVFWIALSIVGGLAMFAWIQTTARRAQLEYRAKLEHELDSVTAQHNQLVESLTKRHAKILRKKLRQHMRIDEYGKEIGFDEAGNEIVYFLSHVVAQEPGYRELRERLVALNVDIGLIGRDRSEFDLDSLAKDLGKKLDNKMVGLVYLWATGDGNRDHSFERADIESMSGSEFEVYCEERLTALGWSVYRKGGTGDQGVDLIARSSTAVVAIQCKRHTGAVGNDAVQQVEAGRQFEEADVAAVISNGAFTPSAKRLASKLGVLLLHHTDLGELREYLRVRGS